MRQTKRKKSKTKFIDISVLTQEKVIDLEAYRLATRVFWQNAFNDNDVPFESVYRGVCELLAQYRLRQGVS